MVISSKKKGRETVKDSHPPFTKDSLLTILEESPNMIFINRRGRIVYANKLCTTVTGYSRKEFYSKDFDFFKLIAPKSRDLVKKNLKKHMEGEEVPSYEYTLLTREGREIIGLHKTKLIDLEGEKAILGIVTNITERKKAEEKLEALSRFPEENPHPIIRIAKDGTVLYSNEPGLSMLKHFGSEMGKPIEGELKDSIVSAYKSGKNEVIEVEYDNKVFLVDIVLGTDLSYVNIYGLEITERKKAEEKLHDNIEDLEKWQKHTVGRELRMVELKEEINELKERLKKYEAV